MAEAARSIPTPQADTRNMLITSALPYVNNVPHLGNVIGSVLSADVFARYCRARKYTTLFVCGTDEYGTATETKALEEGKTCQEICTHYHAIHKEVYDWFEISFDAWGRTPTGEQTDIAQAIFKDLMAKGLLVEREIEQLFSEALGKFLADRFVIGTCPKCNYDDARGDQCDQCGSLLSPTELINPKCKVTGTVPVLRKTKHLYLDLPTLAPKLRTYLDEAAGKGGEAAPGGAGASAAPRWSSNAVATTRTWLDNGLKERAITRDLKWGVPVPYPGYENKVFYVWYDAPIGYPSITAHFGAESGAEGDDLGTLEIPEGNAAVGADDAVAWWKRWWLNPSEVELTQFMGKDNVPFHTVIFPACLIGTGRQWTMMHSISATEYLNYEDGKFSKSRGVGVFGTDVKSTGIASDLWRYYLLALRPETQDSVFSWEDFRFKAGELNDTLGNFVNRTLKFVSAKYGGEVPASDASSLDPARASALADLGAALADSLDAYARALERKNLREGLSRAMAVARLGNGFFQDSQIWTLVKAEPETAAVYISACVGLVHVLASLLEPYIPTFAREARAQLATDHPFALDDASLASAAAAPQALLPAGHRISAGDILPLFRKISEDEIADLRARFSGSQKERAERDAAAGDAVAPAAGALAAKGAASASAGALASLSLEDQEARKAAKEAGKAAKEAKKAKKAARRQERLSTKPGEGEGEGEEARAPDAAAAAPAPAGPAALESLIDLELEKKEAAEHAAELHPEATEPAGAAPAAPKAAPKAAKKQPAPAAAPKAVDIGRVDLRVGRVVEASLHPDATSLYVEKIDVGEEEPRQVISGLVAHVPHAEFEGRSLIVVCNLKPANMRGVKSHAMVLAANDGEGGRVELVDPPAGAKPGDRVLVDGFALDCSSQLNSKNRIFEQVAQDLATSHDLFATYKGKALTVNGLPCTVKSIQGGKIT